MAGAVAGETAQLLGGTGSDLNPAVSLGGSGSQGGLSGHHPVTVDDGRRRVESSAHSDGHGEERGSAVHVSRFKPAETAARTRNTVFGRSEQEQEKAGGPAGRNTSAHTHQVYSHPISLRTACHGSGAWSRVCHSILSISCSALKSQRFSKTHFQAKGMILCPCIGSYVVFGHHSYSCIVGHENCFSHTKQGLWANKQSFKSASQDQSRFATSVSYSNR